MLRNCPYCGGSVPSHGTCCRVPDDLDRFERVFERLADVSDNAFLRDNLLRYLVAYGRRDDCEFSAIAQPLRGTHDSHPLRGTLNSATNGAW